MLLPSLETLTTQLHPLLRDPCPSVLQKATYFFTECFDYIPGPLMAACPWLVREVGEVCAVVTSDAQMISTNDVSIMNNGLLILESLSLELENDKKDSLLTIVVDAVLKMVPDTVRSPKEFCRANSFYALNLIMKHFPAAFASYLDMAAKVLEAGLEGMPGDVGAGSGGKE